MADNISMSPKVPPTAISPAPAKDFALEFSYFAGDVAASFSFNRSVGQIYGLLYMSDAPLSLTDIAKKLKMSKGNASINLRILEQWGAVRKSSVMGQRGDYYEANKDIKSIAYRRIKEGYEKRASRLKLLMDNLAEHGRHTNNPFYKDQLKPVAHIVEKMENLSKNITLLKKMGLF